MLSRCKYVCVIRLGMVVLNIMRIIRQYRVIRMDGGSHPEGCDPLNIIYINLKQKFPYIEISN